jgi:dihydropteroate synthase
MDNRMQLQPRPYQDLMAEVAAGLRESIGLGVEQGIKRGQLMIDPGPGFGKTTEQNWQLIDRLGELRALGQPILLAVSRKRFIRRVLTEEHSDGDEATAAAGVAGILNGAHMLRVHDVSRMKTAALAADAVKGKRNG